MRRGWESTNCRSYSRTQRRRRRVVHPPSTSP
jgi:hypothetical protein